MAERIVSPGVFTREKDLSFLPQGVAEIGAAIIGPTERGPAFTPTVITSESEFEDMFGAIGGKRPYYTGIAAARYLNGGAPSVTVVRVLGIGGYEVDAVNIVVGSGDFAGLVLATLAPSNKASSGVGDLSSTQVTGSKGTQLPSGSGNFNIQISGSDVSYNLLTGVNMNGGDNSLSSDAQDKLNDVYMYKNYNEDANILSLSGNTAVSSSKVTLKLKDGVQSFAQDGSANNWTGNSSFSVARTPYVQSQRFGSGRKNLFRIYTRGQGTEMNGKYYATINNIKPAAANNTAPDFAQFDLNVFKRRNDDPTKFDNVESFNGLNFDQDNKNYIVNVIGDGHQETDSVGRITKYGNYGNGSKYIRIGDYTNLPSFPRSTAPMGFAAVENPGPGGTSVPSASFVTSSDSGGGFKDSLIYGFDFASTNKCNQSYLAPIPNAATVGANVSFSLEDMTGTVSGEAGLANSTTNLSLTAATNVRQRKFAIPFQWGFDGDNPARDILFNGDITANNQQGFDCSSSTTSGSVAYKRALGTISDPDFVDINMLVTPGIIHEYHSSVSNRAISVASERGDTFFLMDGSRWGRSVSSAVSDVASIDNNYVATYYPWVYIQNPGGGANIWVPPSVVIAGVYSNNDRIGQEWFAPAGLNRGGIAAIDVKRILTHTDRDELYDGRVNPIASFPGQGIVAYGQKTLQSRPSALDRVNVRRLLINLKKFIASSSRFLVFEQNTAATRNRFLNIVNPYMESVQQRSGLSAFRVVMDDSNNTPEVVDRNQLVGQIFVQPTRTAEFIVLDFVVLPTGAAFPE
tara:strand:+ start:676 stop:3075 length:2400 start_codon:yes stop_codon:yes gene_type:complete